MTSLDDSTLDSSRYEKICQKLARSLSEDDIKSLKFVLRKRIVKSELDKVSDGRDMIQLMEKAEILSEDKLPRVNSILRDAGIDRKVIFPISEQFSENQSSDAISKQDGFDIRSMNVVAHFKETKDLHRMVKIVESKRAVLIKGPNGCGKSQNAFWYARKFQKDHPSSVVWRVHCKSERSVYLSFATLMSYLKIECILSDFDTEDCI